MSKTYYMRVRPWGVGSLRSKLSHTEICGVVKYNPARQEAKVKINNCWLEWVHNEVKFHGITKAEFDTDLAFELWPELPIKYCPRWWWWLKINMLPYSEIIRHKFDGYAPAICGIAVFVLVIWFIAS